MVHAIIRPTPHIANVPIATNPMIATAAAAAKILSHRSRTEAALLTLLMSFSCL
jgi:hypothetical protein